MNKTKTLKGKSDGAAEGLVRRLVRQVSRALENTKGTMFWDIEPDDRDIRERLERCLNDCYGERESVESVIVGILSSHEETLCNASRDQCGCATKAALASLPNTEATNAGPKTKGNQ